MSLYQDPKELRRELAERTRTGNWAQDTFTDWVSDGIRIGDDGRIERDGAAWWLQGLTPGARTIAEGRENIDSAQKVSDIVSRSGLSDEELRAALKPGQTITPTNARNVISKAARIVEDTPSTVQQSQIDRGISADNRAATAQENQNNISKATLALTEKQGDRDHTWRMNQAIEGRKDRLLQRQLTAETNQMQMQLEYARLAQEEKYRAQDKKDKALMMLLQGLGNLGAAFTI